MTSSHRVSNVSTNRFNASFFGIPRYPTFPPPDPFYGIPQDRTTTAAFHDSVENEGVSRCLPGTQEDVLHEITKWAQDTSGESICWVHSLAGGGKSTVAQSIADRFSDRAATYFFSRKTTITAKNFFPTIAYRLATLFPFVGQRIQTILSRDPLIFSRCLSDQLNELILQPLRARDPTAEDILIIVDGLDECSVEECRNLVRVISSSALDQDSQMPIRFLLFGRRAQAIHEELQSPYRSLDLDDFLYSVSIPEYLEGDIRLPPELLEQHPLLEVPAER
ncbi:hypothetical protein K435DRAFT_359429 [Dendrothele bispora CBS 962.96]|uniref:Nephrocystin 3-like N-terminal domain-containing protein n=1 Tax=Dendrothele bispora (strain CBS 962.96) TaxID=1314807 RepID=A0A4S8LD20_DENBC|nr:hypothetical protein K435DRAFT_359429 [Dendrothele bispora CBS 962.96]